MEELALIMVQHLYCDMCGHSTLIADSSCFGYLTSHPRLVLVSYYFRKINEHVCIGF